jgi:protoporphyrinogen oxidase
VSKKEKIAICGAGIMGLTAAYELLKKGLNVSVFEKDDRTGGMSASFDFAGLRIEKYYHFFCKPDTPVFELLKELGIHHRLKWQKTKMGYFYKGKLYKWGNPVTLLLFPRLGLISKLRFGLQVFLSIRRKKWQKLDRLTAVRWLKGFLGEKAYDVLWESLLRLKFHEYRERLSAAWVMRRLKRVGLSRKNILTEELAYLEGGVDILLRTLAEKIETMGGELFLNAAVTGISKAKNSLKLTVNGGEQQFDKVISTIPLPYITRIVSGLPEDAVKKYEKLDNIGVVCVILKLTNSLTENFWLNINDPEIALPGIIEFSNINPLPAKILYFPFYLPRTHKNFQKSDGEFIDEVMGYCKKINPTFAKSWVSAARVHRYEYAQPLCVPGHLDLLPPIKTFISGLYAADTSYYYPEDRSISESIKLGKKLADIIKD